MGDRGRGVTRDAPSSSSEGQERGVSTGPSIDRATVILERLDEAGGEMTQLDDNAGLDSGSFSLPPISATLNPVILIW